MAAFLNSIREKASSIKEAATGFATDVIKDMKEEEKKENVLDYLG